MKDNIKRTLSAVLTALILLTCVPVSGAVIGNSLVSAIKASAVSLQPSGQCGDTAEFTYNYDTYTLTITGTGTINNSAFSYLPECKHVIINNGITEIGQKAFACSNTIETVDIPESVEKIGSGAFHTCENLKSITIPEKVKIIDLYTFQECINLKTVNLHDGITRINRWAFYNCKSLETVIIPRNVIYINNEAFTFCSGIKEFIVDKDNENFCSDEDGVLFSKDKKTLIAFPGASEIESYSIPEGTEILGEDCFSSGVKNIKSLYIPASVIKSEGNPFKYFYIIETITASPDSTIFSSENGILYNKNKKSLIRYPSNKKDTVFYIPESVTSVTGYSCGNKFIEDLYMTSVTSIRANSFVACQSLKNIYFGKSLKTIGRNAFLTCEAITDVYYEGSEEEWNNISIDEYNTNITGAHIHFNYSPTSGFCGEDVFWSFNKENSRLTISGTGEMYNLYSFDSYGWSRYKDDIIYVDVELGVTSVGANAFSSCGSLLQVSLGKDAAYIGENAFYDCGSLSLISAYCDSMTADNAFGGNNDRLAFIVKDESDTYNALTEAGMNCYPYRTDKDLDGKKVLSFDCKTIVYNDLDYSYISDIVKENPDVYYLYFERLTFEGLLPGMVEIIDTENIDEAELNLTLKKVYISTRIDDEIISLNSLGELLENGAADGYIVFEQTEVEPEEPNQTIWMKISSFFEGIIDSALGAVSRVINFIVKIFKKK